MTWFRLCAILVLTCFPADVRGWEVVRSAQDLERARARHESVPLWGFLFSDKHEESAARVLTIGEDEDPRDGAFVAVHAPSISEFEKEKLGSKVPLNERAARHRRRLGASSYVSVPEIWDAPCSVVLVHWAAEKQLVRTRFAELAEQRTPGIPHADTCTRTRRAYERSLQERLPISRQHHNLVFMHERRAKCVSQFNGADELEKAFESCATSEKWASRCFQ